ncbi:MAG: CoA-binding protein [Candidatus Hydrogenedentota bacterium]|nr:MAG: CoA-binding protein [Candidatus Hydrogenedentota bacterium]
MNETVSNTNRSGGCTLDDAKIRAILKTSRTIAVVGLSPNPERDSHEVARYLQEAGYTIVPVNPTADRILGETVYPDLTSIPEKIDVVDIFRRSEHVPAIVDEAIKAGARTVWMQLGVIHEEAARKAAKAGLDVVMDRCMLREHKRLFQK